MLHEIKRLNANLDRVQKIDGFSFAGNRRKFVGLQFGAGVIRGVGSAIGATVVVAIVLAILRLFPFTQKLIDVIQNI